MTEDILIRLLLALAIIAFGAGSYWLLNRIILLRNRSLLPGMEQARLGTPAIVYFTTPECAPCKTVQRPAIRSLQERLGERLQVIEIDAAQHPEVAEQWAVLSVPTTFVIDTQGRPRAVNHGVAGADKLYQQLSGLL